MTAIVNIDFTTSTFKWGGASIGQVNLWCVHYLGFPLLGLATALSARICRATLRCRVVNGDILLVRLKVHTLSGDDGVAVRRIDPNNNTAYNSLLKISPAARGGILTKPLHQNFHMLYSALGIDRVDLHAALSHGGYTWAKFGFIPANPAEWSSLSARLTAKWTAERPHVSYELYRGIHRILAHPSPMALRWLTDQRFIHTTKGISVGKFLLMGESWHGFLNLRDRQSVMLFLHHAGAVP